MVLFSEFILHLESIVKKQASAQVRSDRLDSIGRNTQLLFPGMRTAPGFIRVISDTPQVWG